MLTVFRFAGVALAALAAACGDGDGLPTAPSSSPTMFLTGSWRGTLTAQVGGAIVAIPTTWTIAAPYGVGQLTGTLVLQHPSFPASLTASALVMAPWTPPAELLIDASWEGSRATLDAMWNSPGRTGGVS
jgi:hypothetical protein